jgi:hypothetical protein
MALLRKQTGGGNFWKASFCHLDGNRKGKEPVHESRLKCKNLLCYWTIIVLGNPSHSRSSYKHPECHL